MSGAGAVVLCGGRSTRMGRAKALLPWGGQTMIEHVVARLLEVVGDVDEVVVVTSRELELPALPVRVVYDEQQASGPLAGLAVGLGAVRAPLAYATSTDAPFLSADFVRCVLASGRAAAPVVDGFVQTLAAAYPSQEGARQAQRLLAEGRRRPLDLLEALDYLPLGATALPELDSLRGFNTPQEYLAALDEAEAGAQAVVEYVGHLRATAGCESVTVPVGTLESVLAAASGELVLCEGGRVAKPFLVSLGGRDFVRDASIPIGSGERVIVLDSAAGG